MGTRLVFKAFHKNVQHTVDYKPEKHLVFGAGCWTLRTQFRCDHNLVRIDCLWWWWNNSWFVQTSPWPCWLCFYPLFLLCSHLSFRTESHQIRGQTPWFSLRAYRTSFQASRSRVLRVRTTRYLFARKPLDLDTVLTNITKIVTSKPRIQSDFLYDFVNDKQILKQW